MPARHFLIFGLVQGVFFRVGAQEMADQLGVKGWVRNCEDGSVEIHAEGSEAQLDALEEWCWDGPPAAAVSNMEMKECAMENCTTFERR